ncbi:MAG TPA: glycoside hydrolase family 2 TIM barrel-domain containing protein [Verrucomicrobiota bacterium]|nr:glycoside hydrolase family 2 TIM barrel-domain containing protein [Verrucomicrobiota bacterium]
MKRNLGILGRRSIDLATFLWVATASITGHSQGSMAVSLPSEVKAVWDLDKAFHETTPTRERICLNGLWHWQPASSPSLKVPEAEWGYFKVPGCWPGITDYMQKDCQTVFAHPMWVKQRLASLSEAWYEREISIPPGWTGRRLFLEADCVNSLAIVFVDGARTGEIRFPGGMLDVTSVCRPGARHRLSILVAALPLKGVLLSYTDSASARETQGSVQRRGLCGDIYLTSVPEGPRLRDIQVDTSVRNQQLIISAALDGLAASASYALRGRVLQNGVCVKEFVSSPFSANDPEKGRIRVAESWLAKSLWDLHTPRHTYDLEISLLDAERRLLDTCWTVRLGFREFWIEGRDFYLNGTRLYLSAVPLDNAQVSAALAGYAGARESLERLRSIGVNLVYTHNYGCEPGSHLGFQEVLRAADDVGMLVAFSQPHFSHYDWKSSDADQTNGYAHHAEYYVRIAQNHPSVVMYSMSHNATGYEEDMNPDMMDGVQAPRDQWSSRNAKVALRAEAIVKQFDPSRIVYHHASGNLGSMHPINFYPNFVPIQEMSDWFEARATRSVKPVFVCEYGAPFTWDWTLYRGWYQGQREFGSARVPWEFCLAEWNAQFLGDFAYQISEPEKANLRWEAKQFQAGNRWHRWDYPYQVGSASFEERYPIFALYLTDNWRAFRTWGVSAISPWEYGHFWKLRPGVNRSRQELAVDWDHLQRPGFSPDYIGERYERMDLAFDRGDWIATPAAQALIRNNRPLLAYLGGKPPRFTSKDHNFLPGETVEKQLIVINNTRETIHAECQWAFDLPQAVAVRQKVTVAPGDQHRIPLRFELPSVLASGVYPLHAHIRFSNDEIQEDTLSIDVLTQPSGLSTIPRVKLFDPKGETASLLHQLGLSHQIVSAETDLSPDDILIVGKSALSLAGPAPDLSKVPEGLKVIVFEQTAEVMEKRLGFRAHEYGLRQVFRRVPDHPILRGLRPEHLQNWRGEATILPPRLKYELRPRYGPTVLWCGLEVPRLWRCGNQGNVASVLVEKPVCGDFLPILDGGFSLQYSPLFEYREGRGLIVFCQMDVTGRSEQEPTAEALARNLMSYVSNWQPAPRRQAVFVGDPRGQKHLASMGIGLKSYEAKTPPLDQVLIVDSQGAQQLAQQRSSISDWLKDGGRLLAIGLDQAACDSLFSFKTTLKLGEHISAYWDPVELHAPFVGIGSADAHNRAPCILPLVVAGAEVVGNGILAKADQANVVFCQIAPWQFDGTRSSNLKRTHRRASFLLSRLLANLGVTGTPPLLDCFHRPADPVQSEKRWAHGLYVDQPEEWDDPYRFFRW